MGGFVVVKGKRQPVKLDPETLQKMARILGITASDEVTTIAVAVSSKPSAAGADARSLRRRPAKRSTRRGSRRSSARSRRRRR
jgi:hypothetical protein